MAIQNVVLPMTGEELKDKLNEMISQFVATTTEYGDTGRLRYDPSTKHFYFEVKQTDGQWLIKAEIGASIIVDALRLIKGDKPTDIIPGEIAQYNREITLPDGSKTVRSEIVLENGDEYGFVVNNQQTNKVVFRKNDGTLVEIPIIYSDGVGTDYTDLDKIIFTGDVTLSKSDIDKSLTVDITGGGGEVPQSVLDDISNNKAELDRLKTNIKDEGLPTYVWRDRGVPTLPLTSVQKYKAYYIHCIVLRDSLQKMQIPSGIDDGAIISFENNDRSKYVTINPPTGETINGISSYKANSDTLNFFVKSGGDWKLAFGGVFPNSLTSLKSTIQTLLPNSLNTIDEISAQLKDRLHTFREIQNEFDSQLHTIDDLESDGFEKDTYLYGVLDDNTNVPTNSSWVISQARIYEPTDIPAQNKGQKHLALAIPVMAEPLIKTLLVNGVEAETLSQYYAQGTVPRKILITEDLFDTSSIIKVKFEIGIDDNKGISGISLDDGNTEVASIHTINMKGVKITKLPNQDELPSGTSEITSGINIHMVAPDEQYGNGLCNELIVEPPLQVDDTPTGENTAKLYLKHDAFEPMHKPGFLAYLKEDTAIIGKVQPDTPLTANAHHDGVLWFDDVVVPTGAYLSSNMATKTYSIEEADELDPNVSGGTDYLIAYRVHMKGVAPTDGFVRIYLYNTNVNPFQSKGILEDKNGNLMAVERHYKAGEELGLLDIISVVNAKGSQPFTCHIVDNFGGDLVMLTDRTEGSTGLLIQALTKDSKTGNALQQFELDTAQNIEFSSHYLGMDRMVLGYAVARDETPISYIAGKNFISNDGLALINPNGLKTGVVNKHLIIEDDGVNLCDFNWGKVFSAEETQLLRGKEVNLTTILTDKENAYKVALMKWTGIPDKYTREIFTTRNNDEPVFQTGWTKVDELFISEDVVSGDHTETKTFTVPTDANNYAVIIYPNTAQQPMILKLKEFELDVDAPFIGYIIHAPEMLNEQHLNYNPEYKELVQDNQGYASLRYTINDNEQPCPVGEFKKGLADVELDPSINKVVGSGARGGEGAIVFKSDGDVIINTQLSISSEKATGTNSVIKFWYAKVVGEDGKEVYDKITKSEATFDVAGGAKNAIYRIPSFEIAVNAGDKLALRMQGDSTDSAYLQCNSPKIPMVSTKLNFKELIVGEDVGGTGVDLSGFTLAPKIVEYGIYKFLEKQNIDINVDIPSDVEASVLAVQEMTNDYKIRPISNVDYQYNPITHIWSFDFGSVKSGQVIIGFYV